MVEPSPTVTRSAERERRRKRLVDGWSLCLAAYLFVHFHIGTLLLAQTNRNRLATDQQNNIELALESRADLVPRRTDGVVNPLWPWVASRFATEDQETFFLRGRQFNLLFTAVAACLGATLLLRCGGLPTGAAAAVLFAGGLGALLPQAVWFQPEPLYYAGFALTGALAWQTFRRNPPSLHLALGFAAGLTYLAKASVTLLLLAWLGASVLRCILELARPPEMRWREWNPARLAIGLALMGAGFAVVTAPRMVYAHERFGDPLHSYPKYWMWQDDFGRESVPFMAAHPRVESLRALPPEERPGAAAYYRRHGWAGIGARLRDGVVAKMTRFVRPESRWTGKRTARGWRMLAPARGLWLLPLLAVCAGFGVLGLLNANWRAGWTPAGLSAAVFATGGFVLYLLAYGWYDPIGRGDRFMMSLYAPLLMVAATGAARLAGVRAQRAVEAAGWFTVALVGTRVIHVLADPVFAG